MIKTTLLVLTVYVAATATVAFFSMVVAPGLKTLDQRGACAHAMVLEDPRISVRSAHLVCAQKEKH